MGLLSRSSDANDAEPRKDFLKVHDSHLSDDIKSIIEDILESGKMEEDEPLDTQSLALDAMYNTTEEMMEGHDSVSSRLSFAGMGPGPASANCKQSFRRHKRFPLRMGVIATLLLLVGVGASATIIGLGLAVNAQDQANDFKRLAGEVVYQLEEAMAGYTRTGLWIHQAQDVQPEHLMMSHAQFRNLYEYASTGVRFQAIGIVPRVESEQERDSLENHTSTYLQEFYPDMEYHGFWEAKILQDKTSWEPQSRETASFYYPLHLVEPMDNAYNRGMLDFDLLTARFSQGAIRESVTEGLPSLTGRLKMPSHYAEEDAYDEGYSVIIFHPGIHASSSALRHVSFVTFRISDLLSQINVGRMSKDACAYIFDSSNAFAHHPVFLGATELYKLDEDEQAGATRFNFVPEAELDELKPRFPKFYYEKKITLSRKEWTIVVAAEESEFSSSTVSFIYLGGAMIFVACVCLACWIYTHYQRLNKINEVQASADHEKARLLIQNARGVAKQERELNDFLSHEVRNPLSAAISAVSFVAAAVNDAEPLQDEASRKSTREDVTIIETSLTFINDLLRNMLDMHRASRKQLTVEFSPVDILRDVLEPVANMLYRRGDNYEVHIDCPEDLVIMTDGLRLKQTVLNLARNSTKFVEKGWIRLRAEVTVCGTVCLYIEDTGPGIPLEKQKSLFQKFQESLDSLNQGTGMGLCLCKKLVELLEGNIALDPDYDSEMEGCPGARFVISLNVRPLTEDIVLKFDCPTLNLVNNRDDCTSTCDSTVSQPPNTVQAREENPPPILPPTLPETMSCLFVDDDMMLRKVRIILQM
jgi:signal transduction histidine kinase